MVYSLENPQYREQWRLCPWDDNPVNKCPGFNSGEGCILGNLTVSCIILPYVLFPALTRSCAGGGETPFPPFCHIVKGLHICSALHSRRLMSSNSVKCECSKYRGQGVERLGRTQHPLLMNSSGRQRKYLMWTISQAWNILLPGTCPLWHFSTVIGNSGCML